MPTQTFDEYYKNLLQSEGPVRSLEWYLKQILEVAAQRGETKAGPEQPATAQTIQQAMDEAQKKTGLSEGDARKEVEARYVSEVVTGFNNQLIGKMLLFRYDPKTKAKLPYYDIWPLVIPFRVKGNSMWALNMHYLPPLYRARLMYSMMTQVNTTELSAYSRMILTYKIMKALAFSQYVKPAVKRYLLPQVRSRIMVIDPKSWRKVLFMPLAHFMKATVWKVWQDSTKKAAASAFKAES